MASRSRVRGRRNAKRLLLEPLEQRTLLSAGGPWLFASEDMTQVSLDLRYNRSDWYEPHISDDGRYVAFSAAASLVAEDVNDVDDVYVLDLETSEVTWVSRSVDGSQPDDGSWKPEISPDGRYVAFMSRANNLLAADQDPSIDVFVFDRAAGTLDCITSDQDGDALSARFSGDGEKIVYEFELDDEVASAPGAPTKDIMLLDRSTGERRLVTQGLDGGAGNGRSWRPHISHDGGFVVFQSTSSNLVANDLPDTWDVFLYDVAADTLECLSVNGAGNPAGGESSSARISGDGRYVTFQSSATDLAAPNGDGSENVYLLDRATNELVSVGGDDFPAGATAAVRPDISRDGRYVVYHGSSSANSQTAAGVIAEVYVYDRLSGETGCATLQPDGFRSGATSAYASISGDGGSIVFLSDATNLASGPEPDSMDLFVAAYPFAVPGEFDLGDAPAPYATDWLSNGARHLAVGPVLGSVRDTESEGAASIDAGGDDNAGEPDDEDGVVFGPIQAGQLDAAATVTVQNAPSGARLDAWVDFNGDGSWGGPGERIADAVMVSEGINTIQFDVPSSALPGETYARFRLSTDGVSAPAGRASDGEVEDYLVAVLPPERATESFVEKGVLAGDVEEPTQAIAVDLDGDGDKDVLAGSSGINEIVWFENDGQGEFTSHLVAMTGRAVAAVFPADVDGDGDVDVLAASTGDNRIAWYENDGNQSFSAHVVSESADEARSVFAADVDGDGDLDILSASERDDKIAWYENDGSQNFASHIITTSANAAWSVSAADVDGDGDTDVLSASKWDDTISWYENDGAQNFSAHAVTTSADGACSVVACDLDGDADIDLLSASADDDAIAWYENDGDENFATHIITDSAAGAQSVYAADVDGDGDLDVLSASADDDRIAWYENDGSGAFAVHAITASAEGAIFVHAADLDADGDVDVLSASKSDHTIAWYENDGGAEFTAITIASVSTLVIAADVDGDGDMDALSFSTQNGIAWHRNDGNEHFRAFTIPNTRRGSRALLAVDIDGDGDLDILSAAESEKEILWYENTGGENFIAHTVTDSVDGLRSVSAADVDADGDMDVLSASWDDDEIAWYENDGEQHFSSHSITTSANGAYSVSAADVDADGDMDVLSTSYIDNKISWYENDGTPSFAVHAVTTSAYRPSFVRASDMNGDGKMDVLSVSENGDIITWHENDGSQDFVDHVITNSGVKVEAVYAADIDGDGDLDVLPTGEHHDPSYWHDNSGEVAWYENDGDGAFTLRTIAVSKGGARSIFPADMDGDGDLDVVSALWRDNSVVWYENTSDPSIDIGQVEFTELPDLDLSSGPIGYSFTTANRGYLTVDASFDPAGGDVSIHLRDESGKLIDAVSSDSGYLRIDLPDVPAGARYSLQLDGNSASVDLRICNLVESLDGIITVHDTASADEFRYEWHERLNYDPQHLVTINSLPYSFGLDDIREVRFFGGAGNDDVTLSGSPGDENVRLSAEQASMVDTASGFYVTVSGGSHIAVHGGGGNDALEITDSDGDDHLIVSPTEVEMTGTPVGGRPYSVEASGFRVVQGYARAGGADTAIMGTAERGRAKVYSDYVKLMGAGYFGRVKFFETTTVEMSSDEDSGVVSGSGGVDVFWATVGEARVAYDIAPSTDASPTVEGTSNDVVILGCEQLIARARGGDDWAELHDSALNDVFIARPHKAAMMNGPRTAEGVGRGEEYEICARGFRKVLAVADQGGAGDAAKLYDSGEEGVDIWTAGYDQGRTRSTMSSPSRLLYEVLAFDQVGGYGFNGGLGRNSGTNRKEHAAGTDFVFQQGYWEGDGQPSVPAPNPRHPR